MRNNIRILIVGLFLAACAEIPSSPTLQPTTVNSPTAEPTHTVTFDFIQTISPDTILIQLQNVTCDTTPCSELAEFTLYADGNIVYVDTEAGWSVMESHLDRDAVARFMQNLRELGVYDLVGYSEEQCQCPTDQDTTYLRIQVNASTTHEISAYMNSANNPETFDSIIKLLKDYDDPEAVLYEPELYVLVYGETDTETENAHPWPLDPEMLRQGTWFPEGGSKTIGREQAVTLREYFESNIGEKVFESKDAYYSVWLTPKLRDGTPIRTVYWLPA